MRITIPSDWDGETWDCVQIQWPASPQWFAVLAGLVSQPARGWTWNEATGSVVGAQQVGTEILARNWPWRDCAGEVIQQALGQMPSGIGCYMEEDDMPCLDISSLLKIENGVLYALNNCCEWVAVGGIGTATTPADIPDDPLNVNPDADPVSYHACSKAHAIVDFMVRLMDACIIHSDDRGSYIYHIEDDMGYDLDNNWLLYFYPIALSAQILGVSSNDYLSGVEREQEYKIIASLLTDDNARIDSAKFEELKSAFCSYLRSRDALPTRSSAWTTIWNAVGAVDTNSIALQGAADGSAECEGASDAYLLVYGPDAAGWYLSEPLALGAYATADRVDAGAVYICWADAPTHDVFGWVARFTWSGTPSAITEENPGLDPGCGPADVWATETASQHMEITPQNTLWVQARDSTVNAAVGALLAAQGQAWSSYPNTLFSANPATPTPYGGGQNMGGVIRASLGAGGGELVLGELRWLHNTNSPSHA